MQNSIADSNSIKIDPILVPHSNAISLLTYLLNNKKDGKITWLDLACGQGQILNQLGDNLDKSYRSKIDLHLIDLNNGSLREASNIAEKLNLSTVTSEVADLSTYCSDKLKENTFSYITFINTFHEIQPKEIAGVLISCIVALQDDGIFYMFDQEELPNKELGAITWSSVDVSGMLNDYFKECDIDYIVYANKWNHTAISSWSIQIPKKHLGNGNNKNLIQKKSFLENCIKERLEFKAKSTKKALLSLTKFGDSGQIEEDPDNNPEKYSKREADNKIQNLYDYWALNLALEAYNE
jgi:ubiquinone/menaquinone biosynthesis C-methylase UbiE